MPTHDFKPGDKVRVVDWAGLERYWAAHPDWGVQVQGELTVSEDVGYLGHPCGPGLVPIVDPLSSCPWRIPAKFLERVSPPTPTPPTPTPGPIAYTPRPRRILL